jgi:hypothetical protein
LIACTGRRVRRGSGESRGEGVRFMDVHELRYTEQS